MIYVREGVEFALSNVYVFYYRKENVLEASLPSLLADDVWMDGWSFKELC